MFGAVLACTAPYVHMSFPKKSKSILALEQKFESGFISQYQYNEELPKLKEAQKVFGFSNSRRFWYAIGLPLTLFFFAILFLSLTELISEISMKKVCRFAALVLFFTSIYQIIWVLWPNQDLPKTAYHLSIITMSAMATFISHLLIKYRTGLKHKIGRLIRFISVDAYFKYINQEDRDEYLQDSFSVYDDITKS